jgi:transcriptional regulator with XRE-family HTH domain
MGLKAGWLADIPQARFAMQVGVRQATISRYISGEQIPSPPIVVKIQDLSHGAVELDDWLPEKKNSASVCAAAGGLNFDMGRARSALTHEKAPPKRGSSS